MQNLKLYHVSSIRKQAWYLLKENFSQIDQ